MPIIKRWKENVNQEVIIWNITEDESYFTNAIGITTNKIHQKKRLEFLASRLALKLLVPQLSFDDIVIDGEGKPYIKDGALHFSISHSYPYIAVIVDAKHSVGIDIQTKQEKILSLQTKFLSNFEMDLCKNDIDLITLCWCYKEAMFKKYSKGGIDFKVHMPIVSMQNLNTFEIATIAFRKTNPEILYNFKGGIEQEYCWAISID